MIICVYFLKLVYKILLDRQLFAWLYINRLYFLVATMEYETYEFDNMTALDVLKGPVLNIFNKDNNNMQILLVLVYTERNTIKIPERLVGAPAPTVVVGSFQFDSNGNIDEKLEFFRISGFTMIMRKNQTMGENQRIVVLDHTLVDEEKSMSSLKNELGSFGYEIQLTPDKNYFPQQKKKKYNVNFFAQTWQRCDMHLKMQYIIKYHKKKTKLNMLALFSNTNVCGPVTVKDRKVYNAGMQTFVSRRMHSKAVQSIVIPDGGGHGNSGRPPVPTFHPGQNNTSGQGNMQTRRDTRPVQHVLGPDNHGPASRKGKSPQPLQAHDQQLTVGLNPTDVGKGMALQLEALLQRMPHRPSVNKLYADEIGVQGPGHPQHGGGESSRSRHPKRSEPDPSPKNMNGPHNDTGTAPRRQRKTLQIHEVD